jgi:hypothetical protein
VTKKERKRTYCRDGMPSERVHDLEWEEEEVEPYDTAIRWKCQYSIRILPLISWGMTYWLSEWDNAGMVDNTTKEWEIRILQDMGNVRRHTGCARNKRCWQTKKYDFS